MTRYRVVRVKLHRGGNLWHVYDGDKMVKLFYFKRDAIAWILEQEKKP
jgi:hypothetical protein